MLFLITSEKQIATPARQVMRHMKRDHITAWSYFIAPSQSTKFPKT